jgi:hypothetical protein
MNLGAESGIGALIAKANLYGFLVRRFKGGFLRVVVKVEGDDWLCSGERSS